MGNPEDKKGDYESPLIKLRNAEFATEGAEIAKTNAANLVAETQTAFESAIGAIEDLNLLRLAKDYLTGVANISKQQLETYMKSFMKRNNITEGSDAFKLIRTINACLFLDDKHGDRVAKMTILLSTRETALKAEETTSIKKAQRKIIEKALEGFGTRSNPFREQLHRKEVARYIGPGPDPFAPRDDLPESARPPLSPNAPEKGNE